ncbi:7-cyano-7-deazaguanine synthase [Campylobacter coli]
MKDTVLSLSGGLDSSALLFEYKDRIKIAVSFKYGSNHQDKELAAAKKVVEEVNKLGAEIEHRIIDLTTTFSTFKSALLSGSKAVPEASSAEVSNVIVPFRNGIFLSILAGIAESEGCRFIAIANHSGDSNVFPDCRYDFIDAMFKAISLGTEDKVQVFAPYTNITKTDLTIRGMTNGLNPDWTYSCYKGGNKPCNVCPTCVDRNKAVQEATTVLKHFSS